MKSGVRFLAWCISSVWAFPAAAQLSDTVHPYAVLSVNHDNNLLRQSDAVEGERADTYKSAEVGVLFERPVGRQVITARAKATRVTFDHFDVLNYNGKQLEGALNWQIFSHLEGHAGATYSQTLASFADFHIAERNLRTSRREFFDGAWLVHPSWKLRTAWSLDTFKYDLSAQKFNNRRQSTVELGGDYLPSSSSSVGLRLRRLTGTYTDRKGVTSLLADNSYTQDELKANINWAISGVSRLQFLGGAVRRKHEILAMRDESGFNGRLVFDWAPRAKLHFNTALWREFDAVEGSLLNSSLNRGGSINANYELSPKFSTNASARNERRRFQAISGINTGGADLSDSIRSVNFGVSYLALKQVRLDVNTFRESRTGNRVIGTNSYKANGISFNVSAQF